MAHRGQAWDLGVRGGESSDESCIMAHRGQAWGQLLGDDLLAPPAPPLSHTSVSYQTSAASFPGSEIRLRSEDPAAQGG